MVVEKDVGRAATRAEFGKESPIWPVPFEEAN